MLKCIKITKSYLEKLVDNLRKEDLEELKYYFKDDFRKKFINLCLKNKKHTYLLVDDFNCPIAIGGVVDIEQKPYKIGQVWMITSIYFYNYKKSCLSFVINKILECKQKYDFLYNYVYFTNFYSDNWLKKVGFKFVELKNKNFKLLYFINKKGEKIDIRRFTCE